LSRLGSIFGTWRTFSSSPRFSAHTIFEKTFLQKLSTHWAFCFAPLTKILNEFCASLLDWLTPANKEKIWSLSDMDADHVAAWSKDGATSAKNCQMLCKTHNRAKGNR